MEENFRCNVLIMGKTGTGKSTLLNYLCDEKLAETGTGKPVTGEGFYDYTAKINGQEVQIYDSWGIEAGKVDRWKNMLDDSLKSHGVERDIDDWFHSIIYCIQAGGGRVEDIDIEIIRRFLSEGYLLTIVLTKADQFIDEECEAKMRLAILGELKGAIPSNLKGTLNIIATCAEKKKLRAYETQPFGKEAVQKAILDGWKETIVERLPKHVVAKLCAYVDEWANLQQQQIETADISGLTEDNESIYQGIESSAKQLRDDISKVQLNKIFEEAVASCKKAHTSLCSTFDINLESLQKGKVEDEPLEWWQVICVIPIIIPFLISERIHSKSAKYIGEERHNLEAYIQEEANHIKGQCQKYESLIAKELKRTL